MDFFVWIRLWRLPSHLKSAININFDQCPIFFSISKSKGQIHFCYTQTLKTLARRSQNSMHFDSARKKWLSWNLANQNCVTCELWPHFLGQGHRHHFDTFGLPPLRTTTTPKKSAFLIQQLSKNIGICIPSHIKQFVHMVLCLCYLKKNVEWSWLQQRVGCLLVEQGGDWWTDCRICSSRL